MIPFRNPIFPKNRISLPSFWVVSEFPLSCTSYLSYSAIPALDGVIVQLYSVRSDQELTLFCNGETGKEEHYFGSGNNQYFGNNKYIIECNQGYMSVYIKGQGDEILSGYLSHK